MIWGRAASSRRDGGERGRLYRISGARQLPCMAAGGKKRATTAVRVRGGVDDFPRGCEGAGICRLLLRCSCVVAGGAALPYRRGVGAGETVSFAQRRMEGDVPAVSNARRLVDRLQGGQPAAAHWKFARKLARPPSWFHVTWVALERFRPYCFPVRAGWGYGWRFFAFFVRSIFVRRVWLRRALPAPAKEP